MTIMAVRKLELCQPIGAIEDLNDYQGVRLYCYLHGRCIGRFDIWHYGHPIGREQLIHEISTNMWEKLAQRVFAGAFSGPLNYWPNIERLVTDNLELAPSPGEEVLSLTVPLTPKPIPPLTASITMPTRDRPEDLALCLDSLTRHVTEVEHEIIVVDNNPSSGLTEPVVRRYPGVVYVPEPRPGVTYARNAGALHAQGDIIVCTDDDVIIEEGWLDNLIRPFNDPTITTVTGMVIPFELNHLAQMHFEEYGGLTRTFEPIHYDVNSFQWLHSEVYKIGVTANCAIRASVFANPAIGPFDNELEISEDLYMFYRILKGGGTCYYEPAAAVRHKHRSTRKQLRRQIYNYGRSFTSMELRMYYVDGEKGALDGIRAIFKHQKQRIRDTLTGRSALPLDLILVETWGHIVGPFTLLKTIRQARRNGIYTAKMFQQMQTARDIEKQTRGAEASSRSAPRRAPANPNYAKFILLAQARTGSGLLQNMLDFHKNVFIASEIFNLRDNVRKTVHNVSRILQLQDDPIEYLEECIFIDRPKHIKSVGFKLLYDQAHNDEWKDVWEYLRSPHIKVIHLKRKNLLDRYLSYQLALRSDEWISYKIWTDRNGANKYKQPIILAPEACFNDFRHSLHQQQMLDEFFKDQPMIEIFYEDLLTNMAAGTREIQDFLGLDFEELVPRTRKQQIKRKSEVITNYDKIKAELMQALSAGEEWVNEAWLAFFDD